MHFDRGNIGQRDCGWASMKGGMKGAVWGWEQKSIGMDMYYSGPYRL